jgi:hypothetical protein
MITKEDVLDALRTVKDPELGQDLVSLDMIRDIRIEGVGSPSPWSSPLRHARWGWNSRNAARKQFDGCPVCGTW